MMPKSRDLMERFAPLPGFRRVPLFFNLDILFRDALAVWKSHQSCVFFALFIKLNSNSIHGSNLCLSSIDFKAYYNGTGKEIQSP
jgi:hypothetical protein